MPPRRKAEDTAAGCRALADDDHRRAVNVCNAQMRASLERSAAAWGARAALLDRLEASIAARAHAEQAQTARDSQ